MRSRPCLLARTSRAACQESGGACRRRWLCKVRRRAWSGIPFSIRNQMVTYFAGVVKRLAGAATHRAETDPPRNDGLYSLKKQATIELSELRWSANHDHPELA